jgi:mannitol/fructose-specific phosphotransferase system IIA component (Ntr-type)
MTPIADVLLPDDVVLALVARDPAGGIEEVLARLEGNEQVKNCAALREAVLAQPAPAIAENGCGICVAHGRTESVSSLVMSAGRSAEGIMFPKLSEPVKLIFVAGIPGAFTSEYLRIVGAIVRMCQDRRQLDRLLATKDPERFVALLSSGEVKL